MGGSLFGSSTNNVSTLDPRQQFVQGQLGSIFSQQLGNPVLGPGFQKQLLKMLQGIGPSKQNMGLMNSALSQQLSGVPDFKQNEKWFNQGVLNPALRGFDQQIAPRINEGFAQHGASFSSRRGIETANQLGNVYANAQSQLANQEMQQVESAKQRQLSAISMPMQQLLAQLQGVSSLSNTVYNPALQFMGMNTSQTTSTPGMGSQLLGLGGTLAGGGLFGNPSGGTGFEQMFGGLFNK